MFRNHRSLMLAGVSTVCAAFLLAGPAATTFAAEKPDAKKSNETKDDGKKIAEPAISQAILAARMAMQGEKRKSPILMLAAAEILAGLTEGKSQSKPESKTAKGGSKTKDDGKKPIELSMAYLTRKAQEFAKGDKELSALIEKRLETLSSRGIVYSQGKKFKSIRIKGTTFKILARGLIRPGSRMTVRNIRMEGRKPAIISVVGDGDGDLDLYVYNSTTKRLVGKDTDRSSTCVVSWRPRRTGPYNIAIRNRGRISERFIVLVNW